MLEYLFKIPCVDDVAEVRANSLEEAEAIMERITARNDPKGFEYVGTQEVQMFSLPMLVFNKKAYNRRIERYKKAIC